MTIDDSGMPRVIGIIDSYELKIKGKNLRIAELEKSTNEMAIIISDLRAHLRLRGK